MAGTYEEYKQQMDEHASQQNEAAEVRSQQQ